MTIYETVKTAVSVRQAAEHYGLEVNRNGMTLCPFHHDRHPSLKLYDDHFYCFGCGATGDVIDFTAQLFGISPFEAVKKLAADFGIDPDKPPAAAALAKPKYPMIKRLCELTPRAVQNHLKMVCEYLHLEGNISSHSFRKFYGTKIFRANGDDIILVKKTAPTRF